MNKIYSIFTMLLLSVTALTLGSCTEEYEYSGAKAEGEQVYFSNALGSTVNLSNTESSYAIQLNRINTSDELTVNLTLNDESGIYSIPSSVTFAQGDSIATFNLSYDPTKLEYDVFNSVTIAIADADYTTPYGNSSYTFNAGMPSPYVSIGTGRFADNFFVSGYAEVEIMQNQNNPNQFRIMHPYDEFAEFFESEGYNLSGTPSEYLELQILQPGDNLAGTTVTKSDLVYFSPVQTSIIVNDEYGLPVQVIHPANMSGGNVESAWTHNIVTNWQENGLPGTIQLAPFYYMDGLGGWDNSSEDNIITITFPGYDPKDYSIAVNYLGAFSSADGESFAMGNVTLGENVEEAHVAVVEGSDVNSALSQVLSGAVETTTVTESGEVRIPCKYSGACTMVAIAYAEGEAQNYATTSFTFALGPSQWTSIGTGLYTDYILCNFLSDKETGEPAPVAQYPVEVQESTTTPGVYRIQSPYNTETNPYSAYFTYDGSSNYNVIINASDPEAVYIQMQPIGIAAGQYGDLYIMTNGGYLIDGGESFDALKAAGKINGTLQNGVISFGADELLFAAAGNSKIYYAADGETPILTLPSAVSSRVMANAAKAVRASKNAKMRFTATKASMKTSLNAKGKAFNKVSPKSYQLNKNVAYKRK